MNTLAAMIVMLALGTAPVAAAEGSDEGKAQDSQGVTVQDLGRGLKSAAQNIEKEIPKIGPAMVDTVKKLSGKDSKKSEDAPEKQTK